MVSVGIYIGILIGLFALAFLSKRRFGLLGLALTAGSTLNALWGYDAELLVSALGVIPNSAITQAVVSFGIVLLPAVLLLFHGYSYKHIPGRIMGSLLFAVLALAFLLDPLGHALPLTGQSADVYALVKQYKDSIIGVGIVFAVFDMFFTKPVHLGHQGKKHD